MGRRYNTENFREYYHRKRLSALLSAWQVASEQIRAEFMVAVGIWGERPVAPADPRTVEELNALVGDLDDLGPDASPREAQDVG